MVPPKATRKDTWVTCFVGYRKVPDLSSDEWKQIQPNQAIQSNTFNPSFSGINQTAHKPSPHHLSPWLPPFPHPPPQQAWFVQRTYTMATHCPQTLRKRVTRFHWPVSIHLPFHQNAHTALPEKLQEATDLLFYFFLSFFLKQQSLLLFLHNTQEKEQHLKRTDFFFFSLSFIFWAVLSCGDARTDGACWAVAPFTLSMSTQNRVLKFWFRRIFFIE